MVGHKTAEHFENLIIFGECGVCGAVWGLDKEPKTETV